MPNLKSLTHLVVATAILFAAPPDGAAQPIITGQPTNQSVSLGANVRFQVSATTTNPPIAYQWRLSGFNIDGYTNSVLNITNVTSFAAGDYEAALTDTSGSVTSRVALLEVDLTFTKITTGAIVTDATPSACCAWGDFNNDGYEDLFVGGAGAGPVPARSLLYLNNRDGTFTRITNGVLGQLNRISLSGAWADFDNDGCLDLLVVNHNGTNTLFHNNGDGTFRPSPIVPAIQNSFAGSAADYDNDGFVDLLVIGDNADPGRLYHNNGNGTFTEAIGRLPHLPPANGQGAWADYDGDGFPDLFVSGSSANLLYRNQGNGSFTQLPLSGVTPGFGNLGAWADYDNDGHLDLLVTDWTAGTQLYHNNGNGTFTQVTDTAFTLDKQGSGAFAWGDYDNDGYLDLFIGNAGSIGVSRLYHNNGDGTFTRIFAGSIVNDLQNAGDPAAVAWADYDNDGFLDLFIANGFWMARNTANFLYHNNGNSNNWIKFKLVGAVSNRAAIGAKVRVKATIAGKTFWQLREISTGDGFDGNSLIAHFGLGDATNVDTVRIEWPSKIVQQFHDVPAKQFLTITEPARLEPEVKLANGTIQLGVKSWAGLVYDVEASSNLQNWTSLGKATNIAGILQLNDPATSGSSQRFYRLKNQ
jgi:hypothetical protein